MTITTYSATMLALAPGLAAAFWLATIWLYRLSRRQMALYRRASAITWSAHMSLFWTVNAGSRLLSDYTGPALVFTVWATVLAVHAAVGIYSMLYALRETP